MNSSHSIIEPLVTLSKLPLIINVNIHKKILLSSIKMNGLIGLVIKAGSCGILVVSAYPPPVAFQSPRG